jgi:hypothetical protein
MEASEHDRGLSRWSPGRKGFHGNRSRRNAKSLVVRHHFCSRSRSTCAAADESAMMSLASGMMTMRRTVKLAEESEESMRIRDNGATCMRTRILPFSPPRPRPRNQNKIAATTGEREEFVAPRNEFLVPLSDVVERLHTRGVVFVAISQIFADDNANSRRAVFGQREAVQGSRRIPHEEDAGSAESFHQKFYLNCANLVRRAGAGLIELDKQRSDSLPSLKTLTRTWKV